MITRCKISAGYYSGALLLLGSCSIMLSCGTKKDTRPNIIFILSDDHSPAAISSYGESMIHTPGIDRIAAQGTRFTNCFAVVSLSAPSRAAILTGKYSAVNSVLRIGDVFDSTQVTFPRILHEAGYQTALFGKWHLRSEPVGFDYYNIIHDQGNYYDCPVKPSTEEWTMGRGKTIVPEYITDALTGMSINWIEKRDKNRPFCLLLHHKAPHHPWIVPEKYDSLFADEDLPVPVTFNDDYTGKNRYLLHQPSRFSKLQFVHSWHFNSPLPERMEAGSLEYKNWAYQEVFKGYYRLVASLDDNIGILLDYLQDSGLDKNTMIIYMSDNGFFLGDHGLFNKQWMYEESIRIPLIIRLPGKHMKGQVLDEIVTELDVSSTILDYAGLKVPPGFQGMSLKPLISGKSPAEWRRSYFYHYFNQYEVPENYGIRTQQYKLIHVVYPDSSDWEFYNLKNDPLEMRNEFNNTGYKEIIDSLKTELHQLKSKYEAVPDQKK